MSPFQKSYTFAASFFLNSRNSLGDKSTSQVSLVLDISFEYKELPTVGLYLCVANDTCTGLFQVSIKSILMAAEEAINAFKSLLGLDDEPTSANYYGGTEVAIVESNHPNKV